MNEVRLNAFENMLSDILARYDSVVEKMAIVKSADKEKTVAHHQLFADKLQMKTLLFYYKTYGLLDSKKK